jgi:hypothetical protein
MTDATDAFQALLDAVAATGALVRDPDRGASDATGRAQGYAYATELLRLALDLHADADGTAPRFVPFSSPTEYHAGDLAVPRVQGGVNPDGLYDFAVLEPGWSYRIGGSRGNDCYLSLSFSGGRHGEWPDRTVTTLNDRQLSFAPDGAFEVIISPDPHAGNWVRMEPDLSSVIVRQYFLVPPSQRHRASLSIEVLGRATEPVPAAEAVARRLEAAAAFIRSTNDHFPFAAGPPPNSFTEPLGYAGEAGALGTTDNVYCMGRWRLTPGQHLVVQTTPAPCGYWSLQAWNRWGQSLAHTYNDQTHDRQIVNVATAKPNADGSVSIVLADADPGATNWLDTGGWTEGTLIFRFLYPERRPDRPDCTVIG